MKPKIAEGVLVGGLATLALVSVFYAGWKVAGLAFPPFDSFDWLVRALPGVLATAGIDSLVAAIRGLRVTSMSGAAKAAEQTLAIGMFVVAGSAAGAGLYAVLAFSTEPALLAGVVSGGILAGFTLAGEYGLSRIGPGLSPDHVWVVGMWLAWGALVGWTYERLRTHAERAGGVGIELAQRRRFLVRLGAAAIAAAGLVTSVGALVANLRRRLPGNRWSDSHALPNANAAVAPVPGTRLEFTPLEDHYRIDADTRAPVVDGARWRLKVDGLVARAFELSLQDLHVFEPLHQFVTLSCVSNPVGGDLIGTTRWTGVSVERLLPRFNLQASATHLRLVSADGFFEALPIDAVRRDPRVMLTYAWDGLPLSPEHGFPLRIYIPDVYGMKQPKWIQSIHVIDRWEPGYWVARGWDRVGQMKATSVIDVIDVQPAPGGRQLRVRAGGIAHAGARGVSKVEVRVDEGEWRPAELREPLSGATWIIWRSEVAVERGDHSLTVRCLEGDGTPQADGFHTKRITL